ncbi:MAG: ferredoxin family protein [Pirellulales bacterium]|nr:ferredoxin family protein [Pirellulales bacterium]
MASHISVVVSQGQSHHPAKRRLEEEIVARLLTEPAVEVNVIPHLYDLKADGSAILCLQGISRDVIVLAWMFPRATRWILNRNGISGQEGITLLKENIEGEEDSVDEQEDSDSKPERVIESLQIPNRKIYCLNLAADTNPDTFIQEVQRIAQETQVKTVETIGWLNGKPKPEHVQRMNHPLPGNVEHAAQAVVDPPQHDANIVEETTERRWYPVIDMSRCTNCMECIDFCLFGVYGVDQKDTILVEQPDNCRKGCPACSRVCPENAIVFPTHKSPAIAGSADVAAALKIDLSKLFGAPEGDAVDIAVRERDEQLSIAGRDLVGDAVGISRPKLPATDTEPDDLDRLIDQLDALDL